MESEIEEELGKLGLLREKPEDSDAVEPWSADKYARRIELIDKKIQNTIDASEAVELEGLQRQAMAYRDRKAPLPGHF